MRILTKYTVISSYVIVPVNPQQSREMPASCFYQQVSKNRLLELAFLRCQIFKLEDRKETRRVFPSFMLCLEKKFSQFFHKKLLKYKY